MTNLEVDQIFNHWSLEKEYIIFGDVSLIPYLESIKIKYIINNDKNQWNRYVYGIVVKNPNEILKEDIKTIQVIIANRWGRSQEDMAMQLMNMRLCRNRNFISYKFLLTLWKWKYERRIVLPYIEYMITTRCTLNCKHCILFMPFYKKQYNFSLDRIKTDIDAYFFSIDEVVIFRLVGGEPFLHPYLYEILQYIMYNYSSRIGKLELITNGTVINYNHKVLSLCRQYHIKIHVSNYTHCVEYEAVLKCFINEIEAYGIEYENALPEKWTWKSVNPPGEDRGLDEVELNCLFRNCLPHDRGLLNKRIYYCSMQCSALMTGKFHEDDPEDYLDLSLGERDFYKIIKFDSGDIKRGYVSFCKNCRGFGSMNHILVEPGEQMER